MNLKLQLKSTSEYGSYQNFNLILTDLTERTSTEFLDQIKKCSSLMMFVNERKVLLQQIYKNLYLELSNYVNVEVQYIDSIKPGLFTNYESAHFREPESVLVVLTKKHNKRQKRVLEELKRRNFKVYVIVLGTEYYHQNFNVIVLDKIKSLYWFMYSLLKKRVNYTYSEFSKLFRFESSKYDFKQTSKVQKS